MRWRISGQPRDHSLFLRGISTGFENIQRSPDPAFLHNHNPVYCGMEKLNILISMEKVGVNISNELCSLAPMAHLYNALRQMKLLKESWPAIKQAIELNMSLLFNGALPTTPHQIHSQYLLCMKWPVTVFARHHREQRPDWAAALKKLDFVHSIAESSKHIGSYLDGTESAVKFLHNMTKQIRTGAGAGASSRNKGLTLLERLTLLRNSLPHIVAKLEVDLITLSRQCTILLRLIREAFKTQLGVEHVYEGMEFGEAWGKWNYVTVMVLFEEAFPPTKSKQAKFHQFDKDSQLSISAQVTDSFISDLKSQPPMEPFDVLAAMYRDRSHYENLQLPRGISRFMEGYHSSDST
jgi:hypothetical protein